MAILRRCTCTGNNCHHRGWPPCRIGQSADAIAWDSCVSDPRLPQRCGRASPWKCLLRVYRGEAKCFGYGMPNQIQGTSPQTTARQRAVAQRHRFTLQHQEKSWLQGEGHGRAAGTPLPVDKQWFTVKPGRSGAYPHKCYSYFFGTTTRMQVVK
jgi:hypothetical protein